MNKIYSLLIAVLLSTTVYAIDKRDIDEDDDAAKYDYLQVSTLRNLNFNVNRASHFDRTRTKSYAIQLKLRSKNQNASVYARITNYNAPKNAPGLIPIALEHKSNTAKNEYGLINTLKLTTSNQRLFAIKKNNQDATFYYDFVFQPIDYTYPEGTYEYTILFTMTQP